jgi:tight adherence protein B
MSSAQIILLALGVSLLFITAVVMLTRASDRDARIESGMVAQEGGVQALRNGIDGLLRKWWVTEKLSDELRAADLRLGVLEYLVLTVAAAFVAKLAVGAVISEVLGWVGALVVLKVSWSLVKRAQRRRVERFAAQLPALARILANGANAGLALPAGIALAANELAEPAAHEMWLTSEALRYGRTLESALADLRDRLPSQEVGVMVSTLLVQQRTGGAVVTALRDMSETLDARKELRREIRTTMSGPMFTGYATIALGLFTMVMLNQMSDGLIDTMFSDPLGRIALGAGGFLFSIGFILIRTITKVRL